MPLFVRKIAIAIIILASFCGILYQGGRMSDGKSVVMKEQLEDVRQTPANDNNRSRPELTTIGWLTMGNAKHYPILKARFEKIPNTKLFFHSFDRRCKGCIFKYKTSYAEGRNILLRKALQDPTIKYMVFIDDDMQLICGQTLQEHSVFSSRIAQKPMEFPTNLEKNCWGTFNKMLLEPSTTYPFIKPLYTQPDSVDAFTIKYQSCCDENFKGLHRDYVWFFYPSTLYGEELSWWSEAGAKMFMTQRCLHHAWKVDGNWGVVNTLARPYPRGLFNDNISKIVNYTYWELGPWDFSKPYSYKQRCEVTDKPTNIQDIDPLCEMALKKRFQKWLNNEPFEPEMAK